MISIHAKQRTPTPVTDRKGTAYAHLAGRPLSNSYTVVIKEASKALERAAELARFRKDQVKGRRGLFPAINVGISSGNGNAVCLL